MNTEFEVAACHSDRAGKAHVSIKHAGGTEISIQHIPFECDPAEVLTQEQQRIVAEAARIARKAAEFLDAQSTQLRTLPTQEEKPGAAPHEGESAGRP